jgi:hypothetical protein
MGYACPVCETPQRDAEHLADHLAFTAMLHGDAHEQWLDEHTPGWADEGAADLAPVVADHAAETPYDEVFEESLPEGRRGSHDHDHDQALAHGKDLPSNATSAPFGTEPSDDAQRVVAEAREMTRAMLEADAAGGEADAAGGEADADEDENEEEKA